MNLSTTQIKDTYGNLVTIGSVAGTPTTGALENGAGSGITALTMTNTTLEGGLVINEAGADVDFRIEGDTDANLLFVDASADFVGIGTNAPDALLTVDGIASFGDGAVGTPSIANQGDLNTGLWFPAADSIAVSTGGAEAARVTANGAVLIGTTSIVSTPDATGTLVVDDVIGMRGGSNKLYASTGDLTATTGTAVYTFTSTSPTSRFLSYVTIKICGRANSNLPAQQFAAEYQFVLHQTAGGVSTLNGQASIFEYNIAYATDVAFADLGSGSCTVTVTNPIALAIAYGTQIEMQSYITGVNTGYSLTSVVYS